MKGKLALLFVASFLMFGCNKLTQKNIIGTWNLTAGKINGVEVPITGYSWVVVFNEGNTGTSTLNGNTSTMTWILDESAQTITFPNWSGDPQVYKVIEKKGNTLVVEYIDDTSATLEYTFEKE